MIIEWRLKPVKSRQVLDVAQQVMAFLTCDMDFSGPEIVDDNWVTCLRYSRENCGVELELDWRERDALVLIVKLCESQWPEGYYVEKGKECRIHLENAIKKRGWLTTVPTEASRAKPSDRRMVNEIERRARLLQEVMPHIGVEAESLFE